MGGVFHVIKLYKWYQIMQSALYVLTVFCLYLTLYFSVLIPFKALLHLFALVIVKVFD